jgi:hypothetical protein
VWEEIFTHLEWEFRIGDSLHLTKCALCLPGTSATVGRVLLKLQIESIIDISESYLLRVH